MSDMQQELNELKETETSVQAMLNEKYAGIDVAQTAQELGMISAENTPRVPLGDADAASDADLDATPSAFASFWANWSFQFRELQSYLK